MKKTFFVAITTLAVLLALNATAERKIWLYSHSGNHVSLPVTDLDSVSLETPTILELSEYSKKLSSKGGSFTLSITTNQAWKAEVNNPIAVTLSKITSIGSNDITVTAMENTGTESYSAIVTITALNGMYKQLILTVAGTESGSLKLDPEVKNLASTGGRFPLNIQTDQKWTASVNNPSALTLSKSSGSGNATINVLAVSNADTRPYTEYVTVELEDGTREQLTINVSVVDEYVKSDIESKTIEKKGGSFEANISSNTFWSVESDQPWIKITPNSGKFNGKITINVEMNPNRYNEYAILTFTALGGYTSFESVMRVGELGSEKCKASDYPQVTIGTQTWMAENYRCSKYDTQSEAYRERRYTIPTSEAYTYTPYYTDASDKSKWDSYSKTKYGVNLTDEQVAKLGYLYNWAAAVGVADGQEQTTAFSGIRQGICPNGWHVPSRAEWQTLYDYIYKDKSLTSNEVGKYLKTTSGWYDIGVPQIYPQGLDTYGFAALPAGYASIDILPSVGVDASFWTATPHKDKSSQACSYYTLFNEDLLNHDNEVDNLFGESVRCLRD